MKHSAQTTRCPALAAGAAVAFSRMLDVIFLAGVMIFFASQMSDLLNALFSPYLAAVTDVSLFRAALGAAKSLGK